MVKTRRQLLSVLKRARKKIEKRENWIKYVDATDGEDRVVDPRSRRAECFCLRGALLACADAKIDIYEGEFSPIAALERAIRLRTGDQLGLSVVGFNDKSRRTHKQVIAVLDDAIKAAGRSS